MSTKTKIVYIGVANTRASDHRGFTVKHNQTVFIFVVCNTVLASDNIAEVTNVTYLGFRTTVDSSERVIVGSSSLASFNQIA